MIGLELTEDHQSKLLEMCNTLFPESKIKFEDDYYCEWSFFLINDDNDYMIDESKRQLVNCHWFEFCITHLIQKILFQKPILSFKFNDFIQQCIIDKTNHPVEYLHDKFKQLTINK